MSADGMMTVRQRSGRTLDVAVIGSGIAGLSCAWLLAQRHRVSLYERERRLGGHSNTVDVPCGAGHVPVDTGFIVYNERNYPTLARLLRHLHVATAPSDMSFAVSIDDGRREYATSTYSGLFAQRSNLLRLSHWRMLAETLRFFRDAPRLLREDGPGPALGAWLAREGYAGSFVDEHLLPMGAAIWSVPPVDMLDFPAKSFIAFFHNHGLLTLNDRPRWRTVAGGARSYVGKLAAAVAPAIRCNARVVAVKPIGSAVMVVDASGAMRRFDHVVIATHADEALTMLAEPSEAERRVLGAFRYQRNLALLHRDPALMPRRRRAWAAWNYLAETARGRAAVSVSYWMNRLQNLGAAPDIFVSLNPLRAPRDGTLIADFEYDHPAFDARAIAAQQELPLIQGDRRVWFCGSYCGYGFHEDALASGLEIAERFGVRRPWAEAGAAEFLPERAAAAAG